MKAEYQEFLESKSIKDVASGFDVSLDDINPMLFDFQKVIVRWAIARGRSAIFGDCGLGKTPMQLDWARLVSANTGAPVLILAPLAVSRQTKREGGKFNVPVNICRSQKDVIPGVNIANYEMLSHFDATEFGGIVLDESSILKAFGGTYRKQITEFGKQIPYRLACTATPAPNDLIEITNHSEFLGDMSGKEIIALFFTQDGNTTHKWRLKGHAKNDFWKWLATWCVAIRKPSDLGFDDDGFILPKLHVLQHEVKTDPTESGQLFTVEAQTMDERRTARRNSIKERVKLCADLVAKNPGQWLIWCDLNKESDMLKRAIPGSTEVKGSDTQEHKEASLMGFAAGTVDILISKPSIAGFGMNFQTCHQMAFVGLSDSYEKLYQTMRRCWRFGQDQEVFAHIITSDQEGAVVKNIQRKEKQAEEMMNNIVEHMADLQLDRMVRSEAIYMEDEAEGQNWKLMLGDSVETIKKIPDESVGLTVFSPPFPGMYAYSNSRRDIGNSDTINQMIPHFDHMTKDLLRVTQPGRVCCIHLMQLTTMKSREGYVGIQDYRGRVIQMMIDGGWRYAGEVTIDKNPQVQAVRNKERGLLFKSLASDSSVMRMALADYLIYFRKDGENAKPIHAGMSEKYNPTGGWITEKEWIEWAAPVWYRRTKDFPGGIMETDVLNVKQARETDDERHLCPLQLGVIERAVKLWSAPGDTVYSPFAGVGSEGYVSLQLGRKFIGCELKRSYWESACRNLRDARHVQDDLFAETA